MSVLRINSNSTAFSIVAKAIRKKESLDPNVLCPCICEILENTYNDNDIEDKLYQIGMSTTKDIFTTIDTYIKAKYQKEITGKTTLSKEVKNIFNKAIINAKTNNKQVICNEVIKILKETFPEENLEYHAVKIGLGTKEQILKMLNLYFYDSNEQNSIYRNVCSLLF